MTLVLDAGAFIAVERGHRDVVALIKRERLAGRSPRTHAGVIAQVWRGGSGRQASMAQLIAGTETDAIDESLARRVGILLGASRTADVIDAAVVLVAQPGDEIVTSDPDEIVTLATAAGSDVEIVPI